MKIFFYVAYPYYFPHFLPIGKVFEQNRCKVTYVLSEKQNVDNMKYIAEENNLEYIFGSENIFDKDYDVIFFANPFERINEIKALSVFLEHGIGTKSTSFYSSIENFDIYLVEGNQKYDKLKEMYPQFEYKLAKVGFSKFDGVVNFMQDEKDKYYKKFNLDINKKTILYAPTFFPSSIERMPDSFASDFKEYNLLIKPHYLTYERKKYKNQIKKFKKWEEFDNCTVLPLTEYNLVPFLNISDVMISDESSAMFEFAALDKPVISNRYFKLRLSYYFMPWKLTKRIDKSKESYRKILDNAYNYDETLKFTKEALLNPNKLQEKRVKFSVDLCGEIDGHVSNRIYDVVIKRLDENK